MTYALIIAIGFEVVIGILILLICIAPFIEDVERRQIRKMSEKKSPDRDQD